MDDDKLDALLNQRDSLNQEIDTADALIDSAEQAIYRGDSPARLTEFLGERHREQQRRFLELGKVEARIEDHQLRMQERAELMQERKDTERWNETGPAPEDHLDWLRPALAEAARSRETAREQDAPHRAGEDRMLAEMHREGAEPEDYLDWWRR